ncbi:DUF6510 family protein [Streptomyces chiangmaiensis]
MRLVGPLAGLHVYGPEPGLTARCQGCACIALRLVRERDHIWPTEGGGSGAFRFSTPGSRRPGAWDRGGGEVDRLTRPRRPWCRQSPSPSRRRGARWSSTGARGPEGPCPGD